MIHISHIISYHIITFVFMACTGTTQTAHLAHKPTFPHFYGRTRRLKNLSTFMVQ